MKVILIVGCIMGAVLLFTPKPKDGFISWINTKAVGGLGLGCFCGFALFLHISGFF